MKNYKTKKQSGVGKAIAAIALSAVLLAGGCAVGYGAGTHWTYKRDGVQTTVPDGGTSEINNRGNLMKLSLGENRGAKISSRVLKASEFREYDIDAQSVESVHAATVTLANHDEASDKSITLSADFESEFAKNLNPADFIQFSSNTVQSGEEFTISCLQEFPSPITIKATANGSVSANSGEKAYCSIKADYIRKFKKIYLNIWVKYGNSHFSVPMSLDNNYSGDNHTTAELYANWEEAVNDLYQDQERPNTIFIETYIDDLDDLSLGTMTEEITDVKIELTDGHEPQWVQSDVDVRLNNQLDNFSGATNYDYPLFYLEDQSLLDNIEKIFTHNAGGYETALNKYNNKICTSTLWVELTGKTSGIKYTFAADILVNPEYMYVSAESPSFDPDSSGGIIF